ncbi:class I SAM-dependent methyltransferase [archaeon]|nr:class I SAM-dependent methyltransferase [archaeon]
MRMGTLSEGSESYYTKNEIYEEFCDAEDKPGKIFKILKELVKDKVVLDVGCGTGKYAALLAHFAKKYICLDVSSEQLKFAKNKVISEMLRVLKKGGSIYLVENDLISEFEKVRGKDPVDGSSKKYNDWAKEKGFTVFKKIKTYFEFSSLNDAKKVFNIIWGEKVASKIKNRTIGHAVLIFNKVKEVQA